MVGRDLETFYPKADVAPGEVRLSVRGLTRDRRVQEHFVRCPRGRDRRAGGTGRRGPQRSGAGDLRHRSRRCGRSSDRGQAALRLGSPAAAVRAGLALVPEDRRAQGLALELSIARNASMTVLGRLVQTRPDLDAQRNARSPTDWGTRLRLKAGDLDAPVGTLSGGNQQKVVLGKWLATGPKVLIIDEPTRGIDVGAKAEVYRALAELVREGMAVLMISSELPEVLGMADRVLVMHEGRISADIARADADEERIMSAALGAIAASWGSAA